MFMHTGADTGETVVPLPKIFQRGSMNGKGRSCMVGAALHHCRLRDSVGHVGGVCRGREGRVVGGTYRQFD